MSTGSAALMLCARDPLWVNTDPDATLRTLQTLGLCGQGIDDVAHSYYAGEKFLQFIAFMGCAPNIQFYAEQTDDRFTHIKLIHSKQALQFKSSHLTRPPHCPQCRKPEIHWQQKTITEPWQCAHCNAIAQPYQYHWRQLAGFGHFFIVITDVYPQEAVPQDALLTALAQSHGVEWQYFYSSDESAQALPAKNKTHHN